MFQKRSPLPILVVILIIVVSINTFVVFTLPHRESTSQRPLVVVPPSLDGYTLADVSTTPGTIIVTAGCRELSMITTTQQTFSIENGLRDDVIIRPTTHDVMRDVFENYAIDVLLARIDGFDGTAYYATLAVRQGDRVLMADARPSDVIGVAVRTGAPIYISTAMLGEFGEDIC